MEWESLSWKSLNQENISKLPDKPGVYAIRIVMKGKPKKIPRIFRTDKLGILCFGQTGKSLRVRLRCFYRSANEGQQLHAEGISYYRLCYFKRLQLNKLRIGYKTFNNQDKAKKTEEKWFDEYERRFGELPPLNRKKG